MGLLYVDLGNLEKAREYAERAQTLGYPLSGLQRKIAQWSSEIQLEGRKRTSLSDGKSFLVDCND